MKQAYEDGITIDELYEMTKIDKCVAAEVLWA